MPELTGELAQKVERKKDALTKILGFEVYVRETSDTGIFYLCSKAYFDTSKLSVASISDTQKASEILRIRALVGQREIPSGTGAKYAAYLTRESLDELLDNLLDNLPS